MKKLLITSAIVAVAGAAAAEVTWSGDATVGYRTHDDDGVANIDGSNGTYMSGGLNAKASAELDGGLKASVDYGLDLDYTADNSNTELPTDTFWDMDDYPTVKLESSVGTFTVGDVDHAAHELYKDVGGSDVVFIGVNEEFASNELITLIDELGNPTGFVEQDDELVGRLDTTVSTFTVGVSYVAGDNNGLWNGGLPVNSYTIGANGEFAGFDMSLGYEMNDATEDSKYGVSGGYTWNGITGRIGYEGANYDDYIGLGKVSFSKFGISGKYEMSNGVKLGAEVGYLTANPDTDGVVVYADSDGEETSVITYDVNAGFKALGADITAGYKGSNLDLGDDIDTDYVTNAAPYLDASYTIEGTGVTIKAGYDGGKSDILTDSDNYGKLGAYYVGTSYDLGGGTSIFASYSNQDELDPAESIKPGARFGVKMTF